MKIEPPDPPDSPCSFPFCPSADKIPLSARFVAVMFITPPPFPPMYWATKRISKTTKNNRNFQ